MSLSSPKQRGSNVCPDEQELDNVQVTEPDNSIQKSLDSKLRAELKRNYYKGKEEFFSADMRVYWQSYGCFMFKLVDQLPDIGHHHSLKQLCNKPTILYWELSAQNSNSDACPGIVFACIYKCWFRHHSKHPDIEFGKFFAHPFRITPTGPQTIPEILKAHAHVCDQAATRLESTRRGEAESCPIQRSRWQHFHLLPLCRAIIFLLDERLPPVFNADWTISLDDEVQRRTAMLVLTGYNEGLSRALDFDSIRSESLALARPDVSVTDNPNVIRVSLKTAIQFISELQRREEKASSGSRRDSPDKIHEPKIEGVSAAVNKADEYVDNILDNRSHDRGRSTVRYVLDRIEAKDRGENLHEKEFDLAWAQHNWV